MLHAEQIRGVNPPITFKLRSEKDVKMRIILIVLVLGICAFGSECICNDVTIDNVKTDVDKVRITVIDQGIVQNERTLCDDFEDLKCKSMQSIALTAYSTGSKINIRWENGGGATRCIWGGVISGHSSAELEATYIQIKN